MSDYEITLKHLVWLAKRPGFKVYAWHRAKEIENDSTGLWAGISEDLKNSMLLEQREAELSPAVCLPLTAGPLCA